jgi:uncharacterized protein (TIGR03790 family)
LCFALAGWFASAGPAVAELQPAEVVVIVARGNRESEQLGEYYARQRGIPEENICPVDVPKGESCSRKAWTWAVRPEIRKWLVDNDPSEKIRCLVTTWGVPLKIEASDKNNESIRYRAFLAGERTSRYKLLEDAIASFDALTPDPSNPVVDPPPPAPPKPAAGEKPAPPAPPTPAEQLDRLRQRLEAHLKGAQTRIGKLAIGPERIQAQQALQQLVTLSGGSGVIMQGLAQQLNASGEKPDPAALESFQQLRGAQSAWTEARALLEQMPPGVERDAYLMAFLERIGGQLAVLPWLDERIADVDANNTSASFDNELALVMWPDDYQLLRWQPNYLRGSYDRSQLRSAFRTLMVSRIDAPTLALAKGLIDVAIKVENEGLTGKAYFDARGIAKLDGPPPAPGSYPDYDRAVLICAKGIDEQTNIPVVLNEKPELFQPGECPDAALYCGWYSVGNYVDAFDWKPGAVAYHLASFEARTLHDPKSTVWCKKLLEDGVCATIGPTEEPYLVSFPRPEEFFALLLQGKQTLVECYWRTLPFASWRQILVGDPLYTPFKKNPALLGNPTAVPVGPAAATGAASDSPPAEDDQK